MTEINNNAAIDAANEISKNEMYEMSSAELELATLTDIIMSKISAMIPENFYKYTYSYIEGEESCENRIDTCQQEICYDEDPDEDYGEDVPRVCMWDGNSHKKFEDKLHEFCDGWEILNKLAIFSIVDAFEGMFESGFIDAVDEYVSTTFLLNFASTLESAYRAGFYTKDEIKPTFDEIRRAYFSTLHEYGLYNSFLKTCFPNLK